MTHKREDIREAIRMVKEIYPKRLLTPVKPLRPIRMARNKNQKPNDLPI